MDHLSRKDFIKLSSWGFIAAMLPVSELGAINRVFSADSVPTQGGFKEAQQLAKQAKEFFYKKDYKKAEELYLECIKLAPNYIQFYDALSNVYGTKNNHLAAAELFRQGVLKNPSKGQFYDRAARSLVRLEQGNQKQAKIFKKQNKKSVSLVNDAEELYRKAVSLEGVKPYLTQGTSKIAKAKESLSAKVAPKEAAKQKHAHAKQVNQKIKATVAVKTDAEIEAVIAKLDSKRRIPLYMASEQTQRAFHITKEKKKHLRVLLDRHKKDTSKSLVLSQRLFDLDPSDSLSFFHLKKAYHANGKYFELIKERQKFADKHPSVYSYLGVVDAIEEAYGKGKVTAESLNNGVSIAKMILENYNLVDKTAVDVMDKLGKLYVAQRNYTEAISMLENTISIVTTNSPAVVNKLIYRYASVLLASGNLQKAREVLEIGLKEGEVTRTNFTKLKTLSEKKQKESFKHKIPLYHLLYKVYHSAGDREQSGRILAQLKQFNPKDQFVQKRN
ncbi:tetratricopeptide repeat protein [Flavobacterium sp. GCM10027622]|uniref:tetratricopeptide repeat protein n=1 Tax=unclassified Flavobacterium TaxID=196869 RepID=UPI00361C74D8